MPCAKFRFHFLSIQNHTIFHTTKIKYEKVVCEKVNDFWNDYKLK